MLYLWMISNAVLVSHLHEFAHKGAITVWVSGHFFESFFSALYTQEALSAIVGKSGSVCLIGCDFSFNILLRSLFQFKYYVNFLLVFL